VTTLTISGTTEEAAVVTITGGSAPVSGMTIPPQAADVGAIATFALDVPLVPRVDNELTVVVTDTAGNASPPMRLTVRRDFTPPPPPTLLTAQNRTSSTRQTVSGMAEPGARIEVRGGSREVVTGPADGAMGMFVVAVPLQQNADNMLSVTALDPLGNVSDPSTVLITQDPTAPSLGINVISGDLQFGIVGTPLARPLVAKVMDDPTGDPVPGSAVIFSIVAGGGSLDGGSVSITKISDASGTVSVQWTLGPEPQVEQMVVANFSQNAGMPVMFMATGLAPNPGGPTSFSGAVLTTRSLVAVPRVTVRIEGVTSTTDANGRFVLANVPTGRHFLHVLGSTSTRPETFPDLIFDVDVLAGQENRLGRPIFLPIIDTASSVMITGMETQPVVVRSTTFPGFALEIQPGSATFPDGSRSGVVTVTAIPPDQVPMSLLDNGISGVVVSIQPGGTVFNPPARVTYPNLDGLAPGEKVNLTSYDHDAAAFINIGPGTVSADGSVITSDPGVGIRVAAWHAAVPAKRIPATLLMGKIPNADLFDCECWSDGARGARPMRTGDVMIPNVPVGDVGIAETVDGITALQATCFCRCRNTLTIPVRVHIIISDDSEDRNANGTLDTGEDKDGDGMLDKAGMGSQTTVDRARGSVATASTIWQQCCVQFTISAVEILSRPQTEAREYAADDTVLNTLIDRQKTASTMNVYFVQEITGGTNGWQAGNSATPGVSPTGGAWKDPMTPHYANGVDVVDSRAMLISGLDCGGFRGCGFGGNGLGFLEVIDITNPSNPARLGSIATPGSGRDVLVSGIFAIVADGLSGLQVVNISNPASPTIVGSTDVCFNPIAVAMANTLLLASENIFVNAIPVFDFRAPPSPAFLDTIRFDEVPGFSDFNGTGIAIQDNFVYQTVARGIGDGATRLQIARFLDFNL